MAENNKYATRKIKAWCTKYQSESDGIVRIDNHPPRVAEEAARQLDMFEFSGALAQQGVGIDVAVFDTQSGETLDFCVTASMEPAYSARIKPRSDLLTQPHSISCPKIRTLFISQRRYECPYCGKSWERRENNTRREGGSDGFVQAGAQSHVFSCAKVFTLRHGYIYMGAGKGWVRFDESDENHKDEAKRLKEIERRRIKEGFPIR
jgi:hypothetical protein